MKPLVIAIDGPAGAGKSTVSRAVARRLGALYLDTGAMYRAATLGIRRSGVDLDEPRAVGAAVAGMAIDFDVGGGVRLDGQPLADKDLRSPENTREIWRVADNPTCREHLVGLQQEIIAGRDAVLEGRDATTVIAPEATLKVYLDASSRERARRRLAQWGGGSDAPDLERLVAEIEERDARDRRRSVGALVQADDAVPIATDGLAPAEVIARITAHAVRRRPTALESRVADQLLVGRSRAPGYVRVAQGSLADPPAPWQLGLTNPTVDRLPGSLGPLACNHGGRQAGVLCQGQAAICLAGRGTMPDDDPVVLPMLPQTWYVLEPGVWHAVVQLPGTICAWAEASGICERHAGLSADGAAIVAAYLGVYLPVAGH